MISLLGCKRHLQPQESGLSQLGLQVGLWRGQTFCAWCLFCQLAACSLLSMAIDLFGTLIP